MEAFASAVASSISIHDEAVDLDFGELGKNIRSIGVFYAGRDEVF